MRALRRVRSIGLAIALGTGLLVPAVGGGSGPASAGPTAVASDPGLDPKDLPSNYTDYQIKQTLRALEEIEKLKEFILTPEDLAGIPRRVLIRGGDLGRRFQPGVYDPYWPHWNVPKGEKGLSLTPFEMLMALNDAQRYGYMSVKLPEPGNADRVKEPDVLRRVGPADRGKPVEQKYLASGREAPTNAYKAIQGLVADGNSTFRGTIRGPSGFLRNGIVSVSTEGVLVNGRPIPDELVLRALSGKVSRYEKSADATLRRVRLYEVHLTPTESQVPQKLGKGRRTPYVLVTGTKAKGLRKSECATSPAGSSPQMQTSPSSTDGFSSMPLVRFASVKPVAAGGPCGEEDEPESDSSPAPALGGLAPSGLRGSLIDAQELGGIDFTSMELRYLSVDETDEGSQVSSAFRILDTAGASNGSVIDGLRGAMQASDAFFVWLSLPPSTFWVNLSPDEPNRIIDDALGRTEVGRVLLEADRRLKQTDTALVDPHTKRGAQFWNHQQPAPDGSYCFTYRLWIVPGPAKVRETDDAIYIVDAPLDVNMQPIDVARGGCGHLPASVKKHNAALYRRVILPHVVRAVNEAPEYQALRRVYLSRIAAEWYRQHSATDASAYSDLIDSGNIDRWKLNGDWGPRQTYRGFVQDWTSGKFDYRIREVHGNVVTTKTYRTGGVDFTSLQTQDLTADAFASMAPGLESTVEKGLQQATVDPHTQDRWLGGTSEETTSTEETEPTDDATSASIAPDDPWSRDYAPILVPLMILVGVGLVAVAVLRERRRQSGMRGWR